MPVFKVRLMRDRKLDDEDQDVVAPSEKYAAKKLFGGVLPLFPHARYGHYTWSIEPRSVLRARLAHEKSGGEAGLLKQIWDPICVGQTSISSRQSRMNESASTRCGKVILPQTRCCFRRYLRTRQASRMRSIPTTSLVICGVPLNRAVKGQRWDGVDVPTTRKPRRSGAISNLVGADYHLPAIATILVPLPIILVGVPVPVVVRIPISVMTVVPVAIVLCTRRCGNDPKGEDHGKSRGYQN